MTIKHLLPLIVLAALLLTAVPASACTSFAVYSGEEPLYGNNLDYPDTKLVATFMPTPDQGDVFQITFGVGYGMSGTNSLLNENGLYGAILVQHPDMMTTSSGRDTYAFVRDMPRSVQAVSDIRKTLETETLKNSYQSFHVMFADPTGDAIVVDITEEGQHITDNAGKPYLVCTNFPVHWLDDQPREEIEGAGIDRYIAAEDNILQNLDTFSADDAMETLRLASAPHNPDDPENGMTRYSIVFAPESRTAYLAIATNYDQIWKINLDAKTIETHKGFSEQTTFEVGTGTIPFDTLTEYEAEHGV